MPFGSKVCDGGSLETAVRSEPRFVGKMENVPKFRMEMGPDGRVQRLTRDGVPNSSSRLVLLPVHQISAAYFVIAEDHLAQMKGTNDIGEINQHGLQAFLMAITGLEAFINGFFHLLSLERRMPALLDLTESRQGSLSERIEKLAKIAFGRKLRDHRAIMASVTSLSATRNGFVHPKWQPASLEIDFLPISFQRLVEDPFWRFYEENLAAEAISWCYLVIARVLEATAIPYDGSLFHWTGKFGISIAEIEASTLRREK